MSLEKFHRFLTKTARIGLTWSLSLWLLYSMGGPAFALAEDNLQTEVGGFTSSPALVILLDVLLLAGIVVCFLIAVGVKSFLKDGELASGWSLFSLAFVLLFVAQILSFSADIHLLDISSSIISLARLLAILTLASGIYFMKKVLS